MNDWHLMFQFDFESPIYLGTADDAVQSACNYAKEHIVFELTVLTILGFKTIVGTPFLWQSQGTLSAVEKRRELFDGQTGLTLGGRPDTSSPEEYFKQRENDTKLASQLLLRSDSAFRSERPGSVPLHWQRSIAPDVKIEPRQGSVEKHFRALFINDAQDNYSPNSIMKATSIGLGAKYSRIGRSCADYMLNKVGERAFQGHFSRALVEHSYLKEGFHITNLDEVLLRTSALYQAANGLAHIGSLFTTPTIYKYLPKSLELTTLNRFSISPLNPYLFADVLRGIGVDNRAWGNLDSFVVSRIANTHNPLQMFARLYKQYLIEKIYYWMSQGFLPSYRRTVLILQKELFYDNEWQFLEKASMVSGRKFNGLVAGVTSGSAAAMFGLNPFLVGGAARQVVEFSYKLIEGLSFFEILRMRYTLRKYLLEVKLI